MTASDTRIVFVRRPLEDIDPEQWNALFRKSGSRNVFYDRAVLRAGLKAWPHLRPTGVIAGYHDERLVLLQPYREETNFLGATLELLEIPTADQIEPLIEADARDEILSAFRDYLLGQVQPDLLVARSLTDSFSGKLREGFGAGHSRVRVEGAQRGWWIDLPDSIGDFWSCHSSNFRSQLRRKLRHAERGGLHFRIVSADALPPGYDLRQALGNLTRLHKLRFDSLQRGSFFLRPQFQRFHEHLVAAAADGTCAVTFTEALDGGRVVGSMYGLRTGDVFLFLMIGFDPGYGKLSPGSLLLYRTIEGLIARGVRRLDLKCGAEPYKRRWATGSYEKQDLEIALSGRGRLLRSVRVLANGFRLLRARRRHAVPVPGEHSASLPGGTATQLPAMPGAASVAAFESELRSAAL